MDDGYWENCWNNDGVKEDAVPLNEALDDNFQIASTYLFDVTTLILQPLVLISKEEHYDDHISLWEIIRHIFTKVTFLYEIECTFCGCVCVSKIIYDLYCF